MFLFKRKGYFQLQYIDQQTGKIRRISTHSRSKKDALDFLTEFRQQQRTRSKIKIDNIPITKFNNEYIQYISLSKSQSYITSVRLSFRMLLRYLGDISLSKIDNRKTDQFISETFARSKYAASLYARTLKAAFNKAVEWNYIKLNPFLKIKVPRIPQGIPIFISVEEMNLILANTTKALQLFYKFAFHTGLRLTEILNLRWTDVQLNESFIKISHTNTFITKGKKERYIPINFTVKEILQQLQLIRNDINDYIFQNPKGLKYNADYISRNFKKAVKQAVVNKKIHFHSIRHSFASNLVQKGVTLYAIKELLGHQSISTTQIYAHLRKQRFIKCSRKAR